MVPSQIGEGGDPKRDACRAVLVKRVGGDFHHCMRAAGVHHLVKQIVQHDGIGRGARRGNGAGAETIVDRPNLPDGRPRRRQHLIDHMRGRGLAIGSGQTGQDQVAGRMPVEGRGDAGEGQPHIRDHHPDHVDTSGRRRACDDRHGPPPHRIGHELQPRLLRPGNGEE